MKSILFETMCMKAGALWNYPGRGAHVVLRSGDHSDFFFDGGKVVSDPILLDHMCSSIVQDLLSTEDLSSVRWVIGPAMGAIKIADRVAWHLAYRLRLPIKSSFTEKMPDGGMAFIKAEPPKSGDSCLVVEDTLTTGGSSNKCAAAIEEKKAIVLPIRLALVNRSGEDFLPTGERIFSVLKYNPNSWKPEDCPLCAKGSRAISDPKIQENWGDLISSAIMYK